MTEKNKGKKLLTLTLVLSMTLALPPAGVYAEENAADGNGAANQMDRGFVTLPAMGQPVGLPTGDGEDAPKAVVIGDMTDDDGEKETPVITGDDDAEKEDVNEENKDVPKDEDAVIPDGGGGGHSFTTLEGEEEDSTPIATPAEEAKDVVAIGDGEDAKFYDTLQAAIENAKDGDTIKLLKDATENITIDKSKTETKSFTLDLNGKTLHGTGKGTVVTINNKDLSLTIQNGTVTDGGKETTSLGGGFNIQGGKVTIEKCAIENNKSSGGGGLYIAGSANVKLIDCKVRNNEAINSHGGAIYQKSDDSSNSICKITDTNLENNEATHGGAVALGATCFNHNVTATFIMDGTSTIDWNMASYQGGGVYLTGNGSRFLMNNGSISNNTNKGYQGGAICSLNPSGVTIKNGTISNNKTVTYGGAIYIKANIGKNTELPEGSTLEDCLNLGTALVTGNEAKQGGGICIDSYDSAFGIKADLTQASIYNNHASVRGDDIYSTGAGTPGSIIQLGNTSSDWELDCIDNDSNRDKVDGWYIDGKIGKEITPRWKAHPLAKPIENEVYTQLYELRKDLTGTLALKAAHERLYKLTIHYQYENGEKAANDYAGEYSKNTVYKVESPSISQYKADQTVVEGEIGTEDVEVTVTYWKKHSGGGGDPTPPKPEKEPTVDIPDDDALGLNNTDHYAYIVGYGHGDVQPQNSITRAEVAAIFFRLLEDGIRSENFTHQNDFSDVAADAWYCSSVSTLSRMGIIAGYPDGTFRPNAPITRAEFAAIATRFDNNGDKTPVNFKDIIGHWAEGEITVAANHGWVSGYGDGTFRPQNSITRADTMSLVNRVLKRIPEAPADLLPDMITWTDNTDTNSWYYLPVQEATNSHYYEFKDDSKYEKWTELRETRDWSELK